MDPQRPPARTASRSQPVSDGKASDAADSHDPAVSPAAQSAAAAASQDKEEIPLWMRRTSMVVFVLCCLEIGLLLVVLPWTTIWTENSLLLGSPRLQTLAQQNFVRGLVSGLGLMDIWLGLWEAMHYRERQGK